MTSTPFRLIPFSGGSPDKEPGGSSLPESFTISGHLSFIAGTLEADTLEIAYQLQGDLARLSLPAPASQPERRDLLWQTTCLELFLARQGANGYWEFNLSPAGHWNVYRLEGYRQGLTPEPAYQQLLFQVEQHGAGFTTQQLTLTLRCPLPPDVQRQGVERACETGCETTGESAFETAGATGATSVERPGLEVGITAVIQGSDGTLSYWALHHPAAEADFHHRGGFTIQVP
ncbi:DOMON-like domain-containing protein [Cyanobium sp. Alchichica 3B3-8F6]|uniref:DOMON-like domain-containing protein n=1 Tax=unclassified Cyanobium TaxID=2627006 RepID=UPI0020CDB729|nr:MULTISPECIES: DOMON-like domain-containing protein [unclassified Cyanobium]MCP9882555.1 DOMON-like domain-containing protein [Cyanobium sp. Alchichica 3B3-8F6]MCP9941239.1 DOMON-like domain-containing protein [Cyanobium sp. ATX 6E8]